MTPEEFEASVERTLAPASRHGISRLLTATLGLCGESGEFADMVKKYMFHEHDLDPSKLVKELGDIMYYVSVAAVWLNTDITEIMEKNVAKLKERYPDGFDPDRSINRPAGS